MAVVVLFLVLHQDAWNWADPHLVAGALPAGLAYHVAYSLLAAGVMAFLVRVAWPPGLDDDGGPR